MEITSEAVINAMIDLRREAFALANTRRGGAAALLADLSRTPNVRSVVRLYREDLKIRAWLAENFEGATQQDYKNILSLKWDHLDQLLSETDMEAGDLAKTACVAAKKLANQEKLSSTGWTGDRLAATPFEPISWVFENLFSEGLIVIAGSPKIGKSWLALLAVDAVVHGGRFLGRFQAVHAEAAYLALEDSPRRLQDRMARLRLKPSSSLHIFTDWPRMPGGLELLDDFLDLNPGVKLIIIDTLARIRPIATAEIGGTAYDQDYDLLAPLKAIADRHHAAILIITHLRKATHDDPFMKITGSAAISGAADAMVLLERKRGKEEGKLTTTSRDAPEIEATLRFDLDAGGWTVVDDEQLEAEELTPERKAIIELLKAERAPLSVKQIAEKLGKSSATISATCRQLQKEDQIENPIYGHYSAKKEVSL